MIIKFSKALLWKFLLPLFLVVVFLSCSAGGLLWFISSDSAQVAGGEKISGQMAMAAKDFAKKVRDDFLSEEKILSISLSEKELNGIVSVGSRAIERIDAQVKLGEHDLLAVISLSVPKNPFGDYINIALSIPESSNGILINYISLGRLSLSGAVGLWLFESIFNGLLGNNTGDALTAMVKEISISDDHLAITYQKIPDFKQRIDAFMARLKGVRDDLNLHGDSDVVQLYYQHLCSVGNELIDYPAVSLKYYLTTLFKLAEKRTLFSNAPVDENRAGLLALSIYLGSDIFSRFIGDIGQYDSDRCPKPKNVVLADRKDLHLHFTYSLGLKVLADSGVSFAIGEFKELMDSTPGGSGFSFADLAADRAGIRLAEISLDARYAESVQYYFSQMRGEEHFFPSINGLPEGLSEQEFEREYGGLEGVDYLNMVENIDQRINGAALYRSTIQPF